MQCDATQEKLWQGLRGVADQLQAGATAMWHIQRVVAKKKDPLSHVCFLDVLVKPDEPLLTERFWCVLGWRRGGERRVT